MRLNHHGWTSKSRRLRLVGNVFLCTSVLGILSSAKAQSEADMAVEPPLLAQPSSLPEIPVEPPLLIQPTSSAVPPTPAVEINPREPIVQTSEVTGAAQYSSQPRRFHYGMQLGVRGVYDDNINLSEDDGESDFYFAIEPSLTLGLGDIENKDENYLRLDYSPSLLLFSDHSENDALQHLIRLEGHYRFRRLDLTFAEEIQILDGTDIDTVTNPTAPGSHANVDVSGRTRVNIYNSQLNASYALTGKTSLSAGVTSNITDYAHLISSEVISGNLFINYNYSEKIVVGLGGTFGYDSVEDPAPDQKFEQANVRLSYQATGKLSFTASGGAEFRQFENSSRGQYVSPVFEIGAAYQPFDGTNLSLAVARRILNSAVLARQDFASTNISVGARQRLFQRAYLSVNVGYQNAEYFSTVDFVDANRSDHYYFVEPAVDVTITRFWTIGGYYLHRRDESSDETFSFTDNQVGLRTVLTF
jgi:Putative beta-barrel porin 2